MNNNIKPTILFVDDEEGIRDVIKTFLKRFSKEFYLASNGQEGLEIYKQYKPDIVISDIKMPIMNGIEMAENIKKINEEQYIIFTTAFSDSDYFIKAIELSINDYLLKPINLPKLKQKIEHLSNQLNLNNLVKKQTELINEIATILEGLLIVVNENKDIIFMNNNALDFFQITHLNEFQEKHNFIGDLFLKSDYFYEENIQDDSWIDKIENMNEKERIVVMLDINKMIPKSFLLDVKHSNISSNKIIQFTEITSIVLENKKLLKRAFFDELTKLNNRAYFNQEIKKEIETAKRYNLKFCLIFFDIDHFKNFNDSYGHQTGDEVLKELAKIIQDNSRKTDISARWGGEEFVLVLTNTDIENALLATKHLKNLIQNHKFKDDLTLTCSFGITEFKKEDTSKKLLARADKALYKAKENGRNRIEIIK